MTSPPPPWYPQPAMPPPPPPFPPLYPAPPPPGARHRRAVVAGIVGAVVLVLLAGAGVVLWLAADGDEGPLAGRPRVEDGAARISYGIPEGWKESDKGDLIDAFTSSVTSKGTGDRSGIVAAGRAGAVPQKDLKRQTETAARSNAEFFYPNGSSRPQESRATEVDGRPAHTVALKVKDGAGGSGRLRMTLISLSGSRTAFLLGVANSPDPADLQEVDTVVESVSVK